jgi:AraC-like DNA-binding protein
MRVLLRASRFKHRFLFSRNRRGRIAPNPVPHSELRLSPDRDSGTHQTSGRLIAGLIAGVAALSLSAGLVRLRRERATGAQRIQAPDEPQFTVSDRAATILDPASLILSDLLIVSVAANSRRHRVFGATSRRRVRVAQSGERPETGAFAAPPQRPETLIAGYITGPSAPSLLIGLRAYVDQRPACSAHEVARCFGISQRTFQRRLRELGTSFQQEINAAHLRIAKRLMQETDNPLKWIAIESGYASLQHFSSSFRARVGLSPSEWRAARSAEKQAR